MTTARHYGLTIEPYAVAHYVAPEDVSRWRAEGWRVLGTDPRYGKYGNERLSDIRRELVKLKREDFPNAGAVLLRVFFELAVLDYLGRTGELTTLIEHLEKKEKRQLPFGTPTMKQLVPTVVKIAKANLAKADATKVEKAVRYDASAPFTLSELHGFVHQSDLPSARDIQQFWNRTEPLFRLMLEQASGATSE